MQACSFVNSDKNLVSWYKNISQVVPSVERNDCKPMSVQEGNVPRPQADFAFQGMLSWEKQMKFWTLSVDPSARRRLAKE